MHEDGLDFLGVRLAIVAPVSRLGGDGSGGGGGGAADGSADGDGGADGGNAGGGWAFAPDVIPVTVAAVPEAMQRACATCHAVARFGSDAPSGGTDEEEEVGYVGNQVGAGSPAFRCSPLVFSRIVVVVFNMREKLVSDGRDSSWSSITF